jgi:hypothetical protein
MGVWVLSTFFSMRLTGGRLSQAPDVATVITSRPALCVWRQDTLRLEHLDMFAAL